MLISQVSRYCCLPLYGWHKKTVVTAYFPSQQLRLFSVVWLGQTKSSNCLLYKSALTAVYLFIAGDGPTPMAHSYRLGLVTWGYQVRIPVGTDICGCAYTVLQPVQIHGVYSAAYGTVHYKEPLKSFERRVGHSPGSGLPSVATLPWLGRKRR